MRYTWAEFSAYRRHAARRAATEKLFALQAMSRAFAGGQGYKDLAKALHDDLKNASED